MIVNNLVSTFLSDASCSNALEILKYCRTYEKNNIGTLIGEYIEQMFPASYHIKVELALMYHNKNDREHAYELYKRLFGMKNLSQGEFEYNFFNYHFLIPYFSNRFTGYNRTRVDEIQNKQKGNFPPRITFTITTCK